jgi:ABC-type transport system involved in multi-copper enzyme maturation permease subunit
MNMPSPIFAAVCVGLVALQLLAALPWLLAVDLRMRQVLREWKTWGIGVMVSFAGGIGAAFYLDANSTQTILAGWGRLYMSILHLQLAADLIVFILLVMLLIWPKGGAVAQAAFREGLRQPMFWTLALFACGLMAFSIVLPYFTFGEDLKMVKDLCYAFTMISALFFGVVSAAMSVHEEIEGRTAVTVMSKPISRRQFFLGKFSGILLSALAMTLLVGWVLVWVILGKQAYDATPASPDKTPDPVWLTHVLDSYFSAGTLSDLVRGIGLWVSDAVAVVPGLVQGFCQVMVLVALATALATRLPMVVNLTFCLAIYFLGNLAPIMADATQQGYPLVHFIAQVFQTVSPGLELFDVSSAVTRDMPLPVVEYSIYTLNVVGYALTYSAAALLFGLILFEDRDLA